MRGFLLMPLALATLAAGCAQSVNPEQGRASLMTVDREWSQTLKDVDKFTSFVASDASFYMPGAPLITGQAAIKQTASQMFSAPGFSLQWTATKAEISSSGDVGYTTGTYQSGPEKGKYVT